MNWLSYYIFIAFHVALFMQGYITVRLYGIDAPEVERINRSTGLISKQGQSYGKSSYEVLEAKVLRRKVKVHIIGIFRAL